MDRVKLAPTVGIVVSLAFLGVLALPFGSRAVGEYYASGALNPLIGGIVALVTVIVFAAGRQERSDPALAAGVAVALGLLVTVLAIAWAVTAGTDVLQMTPHHRSALVLTGVAIPVVALWYARELGVL